MNNFRVHPIIHEYSESSTPFWGGTNMLLQNEFHLQPNSCLLESWPDKGCNPKQWQNHGKRRRVTKTEMIFLELNQPPIFTVCCQTDYPKRQVVQEVNG